jgi:hypothetical protein
MHMNKVGRLNAAMNQTGILDRSIDDVMEHFVYVPRMSPANPQDIPFFLSTRLALPEEKEKLLLTIEDDIEEADAPQILMKYENRAAQISHEYEDQMIRF